MTLPINRYQPVQSPSCYCRTLNGDPPTIQASEFSARGQTLRAFGAPPSRPVGVDTLNREHQRDLAVARGTEATADDWYSSRFGPGRLPGNNQPSGISVRAEKEGYGV